MKKLLSIVVLVCYMASAIGLTCALHYCGSHFKEICFTADTEKDCCGKHEKPGCCHDDVVKIKVSDSHAPTHFAIVLDQWPAIFPSVSYTTPINKLLLPTKVTSLYACDPSPPRPGPPAYIRFRNLRI